jgi:hypothetical protein
MEAAIPADAGTDEEAAREPMVESWNWLDVMASVWFLDRTHVERTRQIGSLRDRWKQNDVGSIGSDTKIETMCFGLRGGLSPPPLLFILDQIDRYNYNTSLVNVRDRYRF